MAVLGPRDRRLPLESALMGFTIHLLFLIMLIITIITIINIIAIITIITIISITINIIAISCNVSHVGAAATPEDHTDLTDYISR